MTGYQKDALDRIARAIEEARKAAYDLRVLGVPEGEASEALEELDAGLKALSDDARAECASGVMCLLFEAIKGEAAA